MILGEQTTQITIQNTTLPPPLASTVVVTITSPTIVIKEIGGFVTFTCQARSRMSTQRLPVRWSKDGGYLPQARTVVDTESGSLTITDLQRTDTGKYICETSDGVSTDQAIASLSVGGEILYDYLQYVKFY